MKKHIQISTTTILVILTMLIATINVSASAFPDVPANHWAKKEISYFIDSGAINGYNDEYFYPDKEITRAEAAKIIAATMNFQGDISHDRNFKDVPIEHWAHSYIGLCVSNGIFLGYNDTFAPEQFLSRQEAITILYRTKKYPPLNSNNIMHNFSDGYKVHGWAFSAMETMLNQGILKGYSDGTIHPDALINRAEFLSLLYRVMTEEKSIDIDNTRIIESITWHQNGANATVQMLNEEHWLLLPSGADLTNINLNIKFYDSIEASCKFSGDLGETDSINFDLTKLSSMTDDGAYELTVCATAKTYIEKKKIKILRSSNVSAAFITSKDEDNKGIAYVNAKKGNSIKGELTFLNASGDIIYQGGLTQIKSRGNSTFLFYAKKSYQIKLDTKTDLLGNSKKSKTWVLLANFGDPTQMHDKLCKDLARDMKMDGTPDCNWIDLYFDGIYIGTYLISEKVDVGENALNITDLEKQYEKLNKDYDKDVVTETTKNSFGNEFSYVTNLTDPANISDGYVIELNLTTGDENCWFTTNKNYTFNVKIPENLSKRAVKYISEFYQEFENAVYGSNGINPKTKKTYDKYCDLNSLVQMYMIYTFSNNQDAYAQSTFFYLSEGKLYAGPIWDSDQVFGTGWNEKVSPDSALKWNYLVSQLEQHSSFKNAAKEYYNTTFRPLALEYMTTRITKYSDTLEGTERMNHKVWPTYYKFAGLSELYDDEVTYTDIIEEMRSWMLQRIVYMDTKFNE